MKKCYRKIKLNIWPIVEIIVIIVVFFLPILADISSKIGDKLEPKVSTNVLDYILYFVCTYGNIPLGILLSVLTLEIIRKKNKEATFNKGDEYKDYAYWWYWFCAKMLGFTKCSLVMVPINIQFKLAIHDIFETFYTGDIEEKKDEHIDVQRDRGIYNSIEINLIISDTYPLTKSQLPESKKILPTIKIARDNACDNNRYDSPELVKFVVNTVKNLSDCNKIINIFATTNPQNTKNIAKKAFGSGDRGNLDLVRVFQQSNKGTRKFEEMGMVVYKR